jgi:hypothetical protein
MIGLGRWLGLCVVAAVVASSLTQNAWAQSARTIKLIVQCRPAPAPISSLA